MTLSVVGAGVGRTGTLSLKLALEQLGFAPCYHMKEIFEKHFDHVAEWERAADGKPVDWRALFAEYRAAVDFPVAAFYSEIASFFSQSKVILTIRDSEAWYKSFIDTIRMPLTVELPPPLAEWSRMVRRTIVDRVFDGHLDDKDHVIACFERHNAAVEASVPAERLLVYDVKQGWEPLCAFLGTDVPQQPFPRTNSTEEWWERIGAKIIGPRPVPAS